MSGRVLPPAIKGISLSKLGRRKPQSLLEAAQHNLRDDEGRGWRHKSNPAKIHLNTSLAGPGTSEGVVARQAQLMAGAGYEPKRHDYLQAFELLFSTQTNFTVDYEKYFAWCLAWTTENMGHNIVLTADSHFDESEPHLHILVVPIVGGAWVGNVFATPKTWPKLQEKFGRDVEVAFGVKLRPKLKGKALTEAANGVKKRLTELLESHVSPEVLEALLKLAGSKPGGLMGPLGLGGENSGGDGGEAFKRIAMSTGKGPRRERVSNPYVIESDVKSSPEKINHILVSVFEPEAPLPASTFDNIQDRQKHSTDDKLVGTEPLAPDHAQALTDTPNADGEIRAPDAATRYPDHRHVECAWQPGKDGVATADTPTNQRPKALSRKTSRSIEGGGRQKVTDQAGQPASPQHGTPSNRGAQQMDDYEPDMTHRERDNARVSAQWSDELGEFIRPPPGASERPRRAARASLDDLVEAGLINRGRACAVGAGP